MIHISMDNEPKKCVVESGIIEEILNTVGPLHANTIILEPVVEDIDIEYDF